MTDISMKITYQFRKDIASKINRMPCVTLTAPIMEKFFRA
jgi:hypothetical protein